MKVMNTLLYLAVMFGRNIETLKYLVEFGANGNWEDKHGNGLVHKTDRNLDVEAVK